MECKSCGRESNSASRMCPFCGQYMAAEAADEAIAEGQLIDQIDERRLGYQEDRARPAHRAKVRRQRGKRRSRLTTRSNTYQSGMVNWVKLSLLALSLLFILAIGGLVWLQVSDEGQLTKARMGRPASAQAYWALGTEYLDQGYISRAIDTYLLAEKTEPDRKDLDEKLLLLAEAYEADGQLGQAEAVYYRVYNSLAPTKQAAYRLAINILLSQDRFSEAVDLLQTAYDKTGDEGFFNQRSQLVPQPPKASLAAGRHMFAKKVEFISTQDYEIYYTLGTGILPETGTPYTDPITLEEGTYTFRAVAISQNLVSDEMTIRYTITLPTPMAPKANMAPKTYEKQFRVSLRIIDEEDKNVTLYYTIDGTRPDLNAPRYTGDPILMPPGRSFLRAIAVNRYGKISNELIVEYKVNRPFRNYFSAEKDPLPDTPLLKTSQDQFYQKLGQPEREETITDEAVGGEALRAIYPWGEARFFQTEEGVQLYHLQTTKPGTKGPRGSAIGQAIKEVTDRFRDMGQLPNDKGDRGIYYDMDKGYARYTVASDDPLTGVIEYVDISSPDASTTILHFQIEGGQVVGLSMRYLNRRQSMVN